MNNNTVSSEQRSLLIRDLNQDNEKATVISLFFWWHECEQTERKIKHQKLYIRFWFSLSISCIPCLSNAFLHFDQTPHKIHARVPIFVLFIRLISRYSKIQCELLLFLRHAFGFCVLHYNEIRWPKIGMKTTNINIIEDHTQWSRPVNVLTPITVLVHSIPFIFFSLRSNSSHIFHRLNNLLFSIVCTLVCLYISIITFSPHSFIFVLGSGLVFKKKKKK